MKKLLEKLLEKLRRWWGGVDYTTTEASTANDQQTTQSVVAVDFNSLDWCWGGFSGKKAQPVDGVEISNLKVSSDSMSYSWKSGGCEKLGAKDRSDASQTLACLFCKVDGQWKGGKFDWISTSRKSRSLENIYGNYGGWDASAISKAEAYAFVIVSKDGKRRTNVITCGR